jgi:hypothetical protein
VLALMRASGMPHAAWWTGLWSFEDRSVVRA